jgi:predicted P-loop ATPase
MYGGESHIYNETPKDRSHIDKSKHADVPNDDVMPIDKPKHAVMSTVAGMHTDGSNHHLLQNLLQKNHVLQNLLPFSTFLTSKLQII